MSLRIAPALDLDRVLDTCARVLERRWVKVLIFVAVFLAAWLGGTEVATAGR